MRKLTARQRKGLIIALVISIVTFSITGLAVMFSRSNQSNNLLNSTYLESISYPIVPLSYSPVGNETILKNIADIPVVSDSIACDTINSRFQYSPWSGQYQTPHSEYKYCNNIYSQYYPSASIPISYVSAGGPVPAPASYPPYSYAYSADCDWGLNNLERYYIVIQDMQYGYMSPLSKTIKIANNINSQTWEYSFPEDFRGNIFPFYQASNALVKQQDQVFFAVSPEWASCGPTDDQTICQENLREIRDTYRNRLSPFFFGIGFSLSFFGFFSWDFVFYPWVIL